MPSSLEAHRGHGKEARQGGNREPGLVRDHEPEEPDDTAPSLRGLSPPASF